MSGFEVAGVVLGVLPIIISALEDYKAGAGVASSIVKWRGHLDTLIFRLKLQKTLFYLQAMELLREAGVPDIVDSADVTEDDCVKLLMDAKTGEEVKQYLGYLYPMFLEIVERYEKCLKAIANSLGHITRPAQAQKDDLRAILNAKMSRKSGLAMRSRLTFAIERATLKRLAEDMQEERLSLKAIIKGMKTQQNYQVLEPSNDARKLAKHFAQVQNYANSVYLALCKGCNCQCHNTHEILLNLKSRVPETIERPKKLKKVTELILFGLYFRLEQQIWQQMVVDATAITEDTKFKATRKATYPPPLIQVPSISISLASDELASNELISQQFSRVRNLCDDVRHAKLVRKTPHLRLAADVFELEMIETSPLIEYKTSTTLDSFLMQTMHEEDNRLTPKQQTQLAVDIASSILQLQGTSWCEIPWNKKAIHFLVQGAAISNTQMSPPFVKIQIEPHIHSPSVKASAPEPKAAILELAILLLEIWHHKPLEVWMAKMDIPDAHTIETRRIAAIKWLEMTSERLPPNHLLAIEGCLAICSGRLRNWDEDEFRKQYCENIIKPLQENCKAW